MKTIFLIFLTVVLLASGCLQEKITEPIHLTSNSLEELVSNAVNGNKIANDSLSKLVDVEVWEIGSYNSITVDSFYLDALKYFVVLLEHSNSLYNRFAIYDSLTNCYLIDKSLNGKFSYSLLKLPQAVLLNLKERFLTEDSLSLVRISFYKKSDGSFNLLYRSFAELKTEKYIFNQTIISISPDTIKTQIIVPKKYKLSERDDVFAFDFSSMSYKSGRSSFDSLVLKEIRTVRK